AVEYKVRKGDSLYSIAKKYHVNIKDLKNANSAVAKNIKPGDKLLIPSQINEAKKKTSSGKPEKNNVSYKKTTKENTTPDKSTGPSQTSAKDNYHIVKKGDTLSSISSKYSISMTELRELNELGKSTKLKKGQKLLVRSSGPKIYTVKKGDNIWKVAKKYNMDAEELMEINEMDSPSLIKGQKLYLEEDQSVIAELQTNEILTKEMEEELKKMPESDEFAEKSMREKLTLFAKKLINIPYKFGGNSILGIDCSAYVKKVYGLLGMDLPRTAREQFNEGETVEKEELSIGDLVFFRTYASFPSHVGIYLGNDLFIHASEKGKKVKVDNLEAPYFMKRFIGAKRLLNDENKVADPQS
ncbi:MAG: LysM peptidoglycan-binding domain-containing protein, partial [Thermodesulfovibrionales bacterium]